MRRARKPHHPLEFASEPVQAAAKPEWREPDPHWNPYSREAILLGKATNLVRRRYGIPAGVEGIGKWSRRHEALVRKVYQALLDGVPVHEIDPTPHVPDRPRQPMPWQWSNPLTRLGVY